MSEDRQALNCFSLSLRSEDGQSPVGSSPSCHRASPAPDTQSGPGLCGRPRAGPRGARASASVHPRASPQALTSPELCLLQPPDRTGSSSSVTGTQPAVAVQPALLCVACPPGRVGGARTCRRVAPGTSYLCFRLVQMLYEPSVLKPIK